jgi:hypothetical protein
VSLPNYYISYSRRQARIMIVYHMMLEEKRVHQFGCKLKDGGSDITDYYLHTEDCAIGVISKYWIWRYV